MSTSHLVVVGDTLLDSDLEGTAERLCPDAPVPVVDVTAERQRPGGAGLAALLAATAGRQVTLVTALGSDAASARLFELLAGHVEVVRLPLRGATVHKTRVRVAGQSLLRLDSGDGRATGGPVGEAVLDALRRADAVLVADYGRGVTANPSIRATLAELSATVPVVWDPHPRGAPPVAGCRLVTPNEREATAFASPAGRASLAVREPAADRAAVADRDPASHRDPVAAAAAWLRRRWGCAAVAVTLGARGALLCTAGRDELVAVPAGSPGTWGAHVREDRTGAPQVAGAWLAARPDVCGAGDSFAAAAIGALLDGATAERAVAAAVHEATRFVITGGAGSVGTASQQPVPGSINTAGREPAPDPASDQAPTPSALEFAAELRRRGGRLVATGGCFDLLHPGHVSLLRQARAIGDGLVVCVNSDDSIRRLKGAGRPIVPLAARVELLAALEPVDAVAVFDEDTPAALLETLRPEVWVKGGDYDVVDLPEAPVVRRHGGEVVLIPFVDGYSTSRLVAAVRDRELAGCRQGGSR